MRGRLLPICLVAILAMPLSGCRSTPKYQGFTADQLLAHGEAAFAEEDWSEAVEALERLLFTYPGFPQAAEARLLLARAFHEKGEYISAASEFTRILDRHPAHPVAPRAALGVCQAYARLSPIPQRDQTHTQLAITACQNARADFPEVAEEAGRLHDDMLAKLAEKAYLNGEFYFRRSLFDSAIIYYEDVVERYPATEAAPRALLRLVQAYTRIGYEEDARAARERLMEAYPDSEAARQVVGNGF